MIAPSILYTSPSPVLGMSLALLYPLTPATGTTVYPLLVVPEDEEALLDELLPDDELPDEPEPPADDVALAAAVAASAVVLGVVPEGVTEGDTAPVRSVYGVHNNPYSEK